LSFEARGFARLAGRHPPHKLVSGVSLNRTFLFPSEPWVNGFSHVNNDKVEKHIKVRRDLLVRRRDLAKGRSLTFHKGNEHLKAH
jgi:hypothetical protein